MAMEITNNYSNTYENAYALQKESLAAEKKETFKAAGAQINSNTGNSRTKRTAEYTKELAKLVPSVEFKVGTACSSARNGKTLTVHPGLLEKMQNDPEKEKDMKDMIRGVESMSKLAESMAKATGWTIVYQHSYIDENGKYHCRMQTRNDGMLKLSDKLREERKKNSEKLLEKTKEKAAEKKEKLTPNKAQQFLNEKLAASKDGMICLNDTDMRTMMEAEKEDYAGRTNTKRQAGAGANLDLKV
ncbi:MAG: DUF6033 family protein [Roseburia sp. 1XD42-69]